MAYIPKDAVWYIADIVEEIRVSGYKSRSVHINAVLVEASSPEDAYQKAQRIGENCNCTYKNAHDEIVSCRFRGLRDLNVIHEPLQHGAELTFVRLERVRPKRVMRLTTKKSDLGVFTKIAPLSGPNIMPKTIAVKLRKEMQKAKVFRPSK